MCAKLLQLCPTVCDPMDCSPLGSSVHGIFQAKILEYEKTDSLEKTDAGRDWGQEEKGMTEDETLTPWKEDYDQPR